jgi:hypothetical protein
MKKGSEIEYYFFTKNICRFCKEEFPKDDKQAQLEHIKKYHDDEMDFGDHVKAHKEGKCSCSGVELAR